MNNRGSPLTKFMRPVGLFESSCECNFPVGSRGGGANLAGFRRYTENAVRASANVTLSACLWPPPRGKHKVSLRTLGKSPSGETS